jgi:hypothetical protein
MHVALVLSAIGHIDAQRMVAVDTVIAVKGVFDSVDLTWSEVCLPLA